jgi:hypothetical protein
LNTMKSINFEPALLESGNASLCDVGAYFHGLNRPAPVPFQRVHQQPNTTNI